MKTSLYGLRGKQLSLFLVALFCTILLFWAWEKNPVLSTFVQPQGSWMQVPPAVQTDNHLQTSVNSEPPTYDEKYESSHSEETLNDREENHFVAAPSVGILTSTPEITVVAAQPTPSFKENEDISNRITETTENENSSLESTNTSLIEEPSTVTNVGEDEETLSRAERVQACNYAEGKWVLDDNETRPLYSGFGCKQWLSGMWACRLTQRMKFDYEKLRWQPNNCQMEEFEGQKFLKRMQDKTIAFVGDSLGRQQFQSLMCMATGGAGQLDVTDVGPEYGLTKPRGAVRPNGWAYRFPTTNTTILYYWSASLCKIEPLDASNPLTNYAMHLDRPPSFLQWFLHRFDILVLNTGHHWNRGKINGNRWVMYLGGKPVTNSRIAEVGRAKNYTIHSIVKWVDSQLPKYPRLKAFYRSISPRHFVNGDWNTGGSCDNETPMSIGKIVSQDELLDYSAWNAVRGTNVKLLEVTSLSKVRDEGHISHFSIKQTNSGVQDCLHWCLPGVPDTWNEILAAQI